MKKSSVAFFAAAMVILIVVATVFTYVSVENQVKREYRKGYLAGRADEAAKFKGVDAELVSEMVSEQQASRANMKRLVNNEISNIAINSVDKDKTKATAYITARYRDGTTLDGTADFISKDGYWYMTKITRK